MGATDDEKAWIKQSQNGDPAAFEELVRTHQRMIHSLTFRMTGSLADAEDLAQETFIRAHEKLGSYLGTAKFSSWLYRIAINTCLNWRQSEKRRNEVHSNWAEFFNPQQPASTSTPDDDDLSRRAQEALNKLPAKQRAAVILTIYDGLNHAEAAEVLDCSEATVSWRLFAARKKLKRWLKPAARGSPGR